MPVSAMITALSQILLKRSANKKHMNIIFEYLNPYVVISYFLYMAVLALNVFIYTQIDYRFGVVINSMALVFVMLLSRLVLKERICKKQIAGNILVILGIVCFTVI